MLRSKELSEEVLKVQMKEMCGYQIFTDSTNNFKLCVKFSLCFWTKGTRKMNFTQSPGISKDSSEIKLL
jgi:hypothetical protein